MKIIARKHAIVSIGILAHRREPNGIATYIFRAIGQKIGCGEIIEMPADKEIELLAEGAAFRVGDCSNLNRFGGTGK